MANASTGLNTFDVLSGISSGMQAFSTVMAAEQKAEQREFELEQQRLDQELQAEADRLQARQKQQKINEQLEDQLAQQEAMQSASGTVIGSGSNQNLQRETIESASEAKQRVATNLRLGRLERESRISQLALAQDVQPDLIESRGTQRALQGLTTFGIKMGQELKRRERESDEIGGPQS